MITGYKYKNEILWGNIMKNKKIQKTVPYFKRTLISTIVAMNVMSVNAEEVKASNAEQEVEVIQVAGIFSRNLESALSDKKMSSSISDGISADDIGSLPALDLGEALQAVPGIQLNREGERRESSVNLRGLPSGFVSTTANGQTISGASRSESVLGAPSPFGAYDAAIFNGVRVIKTPSADMVEGGISGTIDLKLARALSTPEESIKVSFGSRYEELNDEFDPEAVISGSKHFNDGKFAVAGTLAWSKQTFRRDTIKINRYDQLQPRFDSEIAGQSYDEWKEGHNLPAGAVVEMPGELRQATETNAGDRLSFSGGIEWQPTDQLIFGANVIYTKRDMDDNGYEQVDLRPRQGGSLVNPLSAPRNTGTKTSDGNEIWTVSDIDVRNVHIGLDGREWDILEESQAIILDGAYQGDDWSFDAAVTISSAKSVWDEVLMAQRFSTLSGGEVNPLTARLYTGEGDIANYVANLDNADPAYFDVGNIVWPEADLEMGKKGVIRSASKHQFSVGGAFQNIDRESESFEFNAERYFDSPITSVKFGGRYSSEQSDSEFYAHSIIGIDMSQVEHTNDTVRAPAYTNGNAYFGGEAPGFLADGWFSFDPNYMINQLTATIPDVSTISPDPKSGETAYLNHRGFITRSGLLGKGLTYATDIETLSAYVMANFELELANIPVTGNVGFRYVSSDVEGTAPQYDLNNGANYTMLSSGHEYDYVLPSLNIAAELRDDLVLRLAYSEGIVRPNLRAAKPASTYEIKGDFVEGETQSAKVVLPGIQVDPFESTSYDVSLEWYNREGSAITFAWFTKDISNFITNTSTCSNDDVSAAGFADIIGTLSLNGDSCTTAGVPGSLLAGSEVTIDQVQNIANDITVDGYEISIQQNLDFLPAPWNGFGGILNYSHTSQSSDAENDVKVAGISDDTYNAIAYYEQEGWGVRLAYNYRSDYELESVGTFNGAGNKSVKAAGRLDLSAYYNISDNSSISLKGYNLTESLYEEYESVEWQPRATHFDGRVFVLSYQHTFF